MLSFAPSAAAGWHFDSVKAKYGNKAERRSFFFIALYPEKHGATSRLFFCRNVNRDIQTQPKQKLFEVDFKADSSAIVFIFCRNVDTYIQTQPKQEMFEVDLKADSTAIVF